MKGKFSGKFWLNTAVWVWALWLSLYPSTISVWFIPIGLIPGLINCVLGVFLTEAREGVK